MDLTPQEKSRAWWKGTLMGAAKGLAVGLAVGAASALLLELVLPSFPVIYNVFKSFLMMSPAAGAPPVFSVVPLAIFSGVSGLIGGLFSGGSNNVTAYHQNRHNKLQMQQDTKLNELDGRVQALEYFRPVNARVETIIAQGPKKDQSFAEAELETRAEATKADRTIH